MYVAAEKADLSNILFVSGKTYKQKFELGRLKTLISQRTNGSLTPAQISTYCIEDDSEEGKKIFDLMQRNISDNYNFMRLDGDGSGNIVSIDFGEYDSKPQGVISLSKNSINGDDPEDKVTIILTIDRKYTGAVNLKIRGPINEFSKVLTFSDSDSASFEFHSSFYGDYYLPSTPIDEFQNVPPKTLKVDF